MNLRSAFFTLAAVCVVVAAPSPKPDRDEGMRHRGGRNTHSRTGKAKPSRSVDVDSASSSASMTSSSSAASASTLSAPTLSGTFTGSSNRTDGVSESLTSNSSGSNLASNGADVGVVGTLYFLTNVPDSNNIVTATIGFDGNITYAGAIYAGGSGTHGNDGGAFAADVTFSNNLIIVHREKQLLATVNTQSNTVVLFRIDPNNPTDLKMLGEPVPSQGDYPNSLTFNNAGDRLCVVNAGTVGNFICYDVNDSGLSPDMDSIRPIPNYNQTTPPTGPSQTASVITFTPDEKDIVVAVKGTENPPSPGFLVAWPLEDGGRFASDPTVIQKAGPGNLPFSLTPVRGRNAFVAADLSSAVDVFDLSGDISDSSGSNGTNSRSIDGELMLCWSTYSPTLDRYYLSAPPSSLVVEVTVDKDLQTSVVANHVIPDNVLDTDLAIATIDGKDFLFTLLTNAPGLASLSLDGPGRTTFVGSADFSRFLAGDGIPFRRNFAQGLAVFVKP
ncbi:hypothetical protein K488DRAFT_88842 [Vararia minispora EC-137]|uniref:Uncharacterized protein n=1 Tax=Vararia minispora EC-137 TaxID=1314806 RepID=A0ACB8QC61_9AGAM|nr:hypothetical protein K488DRAFT_88842 [Vararia minispora EC-137]